MLSTRFALSSILLALSLSGVGANAQLAAPGLPGTAIWYMHADLDELRNAPSGRQLYRWLEDEVFAEVRENFGVDPGKEANSLTAFSDAVLGTVIIVDGSISDTTRDKLVALAAADAKLEVLSHKGMTYYHADRSSSSSRNNRSLDDLEKGAWFSFDVKDKLIVASDRNQLEALLDSRGRIAGNQNHPGALLVMTADRSFVQAGMRTSAFAGGNGRGWDSNILRNAEQVALLVSDRDGFISLEARLVSREPGMAQALGSIVNGLLNLQALSPDLDPDILALIRGTRIDVKDRVLSINAVLRPEMVADMLEGKSRR